MAGSERDACRPDEIIDRLVAGLRERSDELLTTLHGKAIRLQVTVTGERTRSFRIVVTGTGSVALLLPANLAGEEFRPHLVVVGTPAELIGFVTGRDSWRSAIDAGTAIPYRDPVEVEPFRQLVASELRKILDGC